MDRAEMNPSSSGISAKSSCPAGGTFARIRWASPHAEADSNTRTQEVSSTHSIATGKSSKWFAYANRRAVGKCEIGVPLSKSAFFRKAAKGCEFGYIFSSQKADERVQSYFVLLSRSCDIAVSSSSLSLLRCRKRDHSAIKMTPILNA